MGRSFQTVLPFQRTHRVLRPARERAPAGSPRILSLLPLARFNRGGVSGACPDLAAPFLSAADRGQELLAKHDARLERSMDPAELKRFERTFLPHMSAAYNLARWLTHSEQDAEDVVQE